MTPQEALNLLEKNPCDVTPAITALSHAADLDDAALPQLCARIAAALTSAQDVEDLLGGRAAAMANFYPSQEQTTPSTDQTIDSFLASFGADDPREQQLLERMIFSGVPDYAATLAAEASALPPLGDEHVTEPAQLTPQSEESTNQAATPSSSPSAPNSASLTESFVRILIKNKNYAKALEIISEQNLKNPKKSIYFADQMRFLKKLIINETKK